MCGNQPVPRAGGSPQGPGAGRAPSALGEEVGALQAGLKKQRGLPDRGCGGCKQPLALGAAQPRPRAEASGTLTWSRHPRVGVGGQAQGITTLTWKKLLIACESKNLQKTQCAQAGAWWCHMQHTDPTH